MWDDFDIDFDFDFDFDSTYGDAIEYIDPDPIFIDEFGEFYPDEIFQDDGFVFDEFDSGADYGYDSGSELEIESEFPDDEYYYEQEIEQAQVPSVPSQLPRIPQAPGPSSPPLLSLPGIVDAAKAVLPFIAKSRGGSARAASGPQVRNLPLNYANPLSRPIGAGAYGASSGFPAVNRQRLQARPGLTAPNNNRMLLIGGGLIAATLLVFAATRSR